ncbi:DgyrCDS7054 [Dimorphilus gyrociliatus]|uniref:Epoxide hydrolase n=1 Tax=Dimorphilus gyrociliatus TaxID=2664684 RepID=A0A7I8VQ24_9ANNE|nr:DgyrCDS7054 [Dimorphilus gyrociliatus]
MSCLRNFLITPIFCIVVVIASLGLLKCFSPAVKPEIAEDGWWALEEKPKDYPNFLKFQPEEFKIKFEDHMIKDLKERLSKTKFASPLVDTKFHYGINIEHLKSILLYWQNVYDFKKYENELNKFSHYKVEIEGIKVHFLRAKTTAAKNVKPILLIHGWPGSIWEFYKMIPLLLENGSFDIICPSIPGYGFSEAPHRQGFNALETARIFRKLMHILGYEKFYVQGGDWGSLIASLLSAAYPNSIEGMHVNMGIPAYARKSALIKYYLSQLFPSSFLDEIDSAKTTFIGSFFNVLLETGYFHIQGTKPDTVGVALQDSPAGLAGYILEKFSTWTNSSYKDLFDGGLTKKFTLDELLTNIMIYWSTNSITSSVRYYKENICNEDLQFRWSLVPIEVPSGYADFPNELVPITKLGVETKIANLIHFEHMERGGHFGAFEEPELLSKDIIKFINKVEQLKKDEQLKNSK